MTKSTGAIVYWIDTDYSVRTEIIRPYQLKGGATYQSEAMHISDCADDIEVIMIERANEPYEKEAIERLKNKAGALRKSKARN